MELLFRSYKKGDEKKIIELFQLVFKQEMTIDYWEWRFKNNPYGDLEISLAFDGDELVGHYAISPVIFTSNGQLFKAAHSMTTMTHPDYQGKGIFNKLANHLYGELKAKSFDFIWGFPNANSYYGFMKNLAWSPVTIIPNLKCSTPLKKDAVVNVIKSSKPFSGKECTFFSSSKVGVLKNEEYFKWRYELNPSNKYDFLRFESNGELVGLAVSKIYKNEMDILELVSDDSYVEGVIESLRYHYLNNEGKESLNLWMSIFDQRYLSILKNGFFLSEPLTSLGYLPLSENCKRSITPNYSNWQISMGDSDVY